MSYGIPGISDAELQATMGLRPTRSNRGMYVPGMMQQGQDQFFGSQQQPQQEFSIWRAAGKFFQGAVVDTITGLFSVKGLAMMAGAGVICALGGAPLVLGAGLLLGGFQLAKGAYGAVSNYASGNYAQAEESFRDIGGGTVAVAGSWMGLRARYASAEGFSGKMGALWGDIRGKSVYNFTNSAGEAATGNMYQMMGSRAKTGFNNVYQVFKPTAGSAAADQTFGARLKGLFVAEESVASTRIAAKEAADIAKQQRALTAECEVVADVVKNQSRLPGYGNLATEAEALNTLKGLTAPQYKALQTQLAALEEASVAEFLANVTKLPKHAGMTAEALAKLPASDIIALQAEVTHASNIARAGAVPELVTAAGKLFPGTAIADMNAAQLAQLETAAGLLKTATTQVTNIGGTASKVPATLVTELGVSADAIASMSAEQLALALAEKRIAAQAANTPNFLARVTNSDAWRNTVGRVDGAPNQFQIGEQVFTNYNSGLATVGTRRIIGATAGNVLRED